MTNEEMIKAMFPDVEVIRRGFRTEIRAQKFMVTTITDWLDAPYESGTSIKALEQQPKPLEKFDNVKQHIDRLAGDYKCWDNRLSYDEALELCRILETQPCEDCVSRAYIEPIVEELENICIYADEYILSLLASIKNAPSVTPKFTDEEIQKMQELEQAQLEKAYELGMQTSFEEWLSTFNTDRASECFTAVQELKKRLEGEE